MLVRHPAVAALVATASLTAPAAARAADVSIANKAFGPADVTIPSGDSVTWSWGDGPHNVHVVQGPEVFDSGIKSAGGTYTRTLTAAGVYTYQCDVHPSMRGQVTVTAGPAGASAPAPAIGFAPPRLGAVEVSTLAVVRLVASQAATLDVDILRGARLVKRTTATLVSGANRLPLPVRALPLGLYRLRVSARDTAGRRSAPVMRSFVVTRAARAWRPAPQPAAPRPAPAPAAPPAPVDDHGQHGPGHE